MEMRKFRQDFILRRRKLLIQLENLQKKRFEFEKQINNIEEELDSLDTYLIRDYKNNQKEKT
jgi:hypothetical protein